MSDQVVALIVDTETTGLSAGDEPIEVALVRCALDSQGNQLGDAVRYTGRRAPSVPINPRAQQVHGISAEDLRGLDFDHSTIKEMIAGADVLIAHNASFDARMLAKLYPDVKSKSWRCTYRQWPWAAPPAGRKLADVAALCGIPFENAHNADADADVLRAALLTRTGKTDRSKTHFAKLIAKGDHYIDWDGGRRDPSRAANDRVIGTIHVTFSADAPVTPPKPTGERTPEQMWEDFHRMRKAFGLWGSVLMIGFLALGVGSCIAR